MSQDRIWFCNPAKSGCGGTKVKRNNKWACPHCEPAAFEDVSPVVMQSILHPLFAPIVEYPERTIDRYSK